MTDTTYATDGVTGKLEFIQYHLTGLTAGDYIISVKQNVQIGNKAVASSPFSVERTFSVAGERFSIQPSEIQAVFPPANSLGEHSSVLPHIVFNRSTLPWEREGDAQKAHVPWLALLLFEETERPKESVVMLKDLPIVKEDPTTHQKIRFPTFVLEKGQKPDDQVVIIDVEKSLLQKLLPTASDLALLAHVRQRTNEDGVPNDEDQAVLVSNRLPIMGGSSWVYLVSVEGRFSNGVFDYQGAGNTDLIRLVTLKSWSFTCVDETQNFKGLLKNLNRNPSTLRLPKNDSAEAEKYLNSGYTLLPHSFRGTGKTASWYRGPLITAEDTSDLQRSARTADELIRFNPANGLFDISYAAAWELGRLMALQSKQFSTGLYTWKRSAVQQLRQAEQLLLHPDLPVQAQTSSDPLPDIPPTIQSWFDNLKQLRGVPFNYLVPDERMLPSESIRFFWVDHFWVDCLLDGAFSIGRVTTADHKQDQNFSDNPTAYAYERISGFLMRSDVVSGWPSLQVNGYGQDRKELPLVRMDTLSSNVLICLFRGKLSSIAVHQKPEALHFGLDRNGAFYKMLRADHGTPKVDPIPWRQDPASQIGARVLDITALADAIQTQLHTDPPTSAQFAYQMIEGVEKVLFQKEL